MAGSISSVNLLSPGWSSGLDSSGVAYGADTGDVTERAVARMFRPREADPFATLQSGRDIVRIQSPHTNNWTTDSINSLKAKIDGASIATVCNEDGTITTTLTWG